jgi:hypothetical protein
MKSPFQQFQQQQHQRQRDMMGYAWMKEQNRLKGTEDQYQYSRKKSGGFIKTILFLIFCYAIYYLFFSQ